MKIMLWIWGKARQRVDAWWSYVPEPRAVSAFFTAVYALSFTTGLTTFLAPSLTLHRIADPFTISIIAVFLMAGAIISGAGGYLDYWRLERVGLTFQLAALTIYFVLTLVIFILPGPHPINPWLVALSTAALILRYVLIRVFTRRPGTVRR